jgi:dephospho-CoA kinase
MKSIYGLTGGIACGKSTVATMFAEKDVGVLNTDALARVIMQEPHVSRTLIDSVAASGYDITAANEYLDFTKLAKIFFLDPKVKKDVERIVHPLVWQKVDNDIRVSAKPLWVVESAIIYETGSQDRFHDVITVICNQKMQIARLALRGYSCEDIEARMASQNTRSHTEMTITTSGSLEETRRQVDKIHGLLLKEAR